MHDIVDGDILKTVFSRSPQEREKGFETSLIAVIVSSTLVFEGGTEQYTTGPWKLLLTRPASQLCSHCSNRFLLDLSLLV
jgi:hypothetical protein